MRKLRVFVPALALACTAGAALAQSGSGWVDPPAQLPATPPASSAPVPAPEPAAPAPRVAPAPRAEVPRAQPAPRAEARRAPIETRRRAATEIRRSRIVEAPRPRAITRAPMPEPSYIPAPEIRAEVDHPSPSFNCRYAGTSVERAICADPDLAAKDRIMASLYEKVGGSRHGPVDPTQWRWLAARNACARAGGALSACIRRHYDARIAELSGWRR